MAQRRIRGKFAKVTVLEDGPRVGTGRKQRIRSRGRVYLSSGAVRVDRVLVDREDVARGWTPQWGMGAHDRADIWTPPANA